MRVLNNGYFSDTWTSEDLSKGLRSTDKSIRNQKVLTRCDGMVGIDGLLGTIPTITLSTLWSNDLIIKDDFPFPQIFALDKFMLICNRASILEYNGATLISKISATGGELWTVASAHDFIYLSNGVVSIIRDPATGNYSLSDAPVCSAILNFNGQIICGNIR